MSKSLSKLAYYLNSIDLSIESKNVLSILKLAQEDEFLNSKGKVTEVSLHTAKSNGMYNFEVLPDEKQFFIYSDGDKLDNQENIKRISEGIMKGQYKLDQHLLNYFKRDGVTAFRSSQPPMFTSNSDISEDLQQKKQKSCCGQPSGVLYCF